MSTADRLADARRAGDLIAEVRELRRIHPDFSEFYGSLLSAEADARCALDAIYSEEEELATEIEQQLGQCSTCHGAGKVWRHVPSDQAWILDPEVACAQCDGTGQVGATRKVPDGMVEAIKAEDAALFAGSRLSLMLRIARRIAAKEMEDRRDRAHLDHRNAAAERLRFAAGAKRQHGARVALENDRARAHYTTGEKDARGRWVKGERVAYGTEGEIFWTSNERDRYGIKTDDGRVFYTSVDNVTRYPINGWDLVIQSAVEKQTLRVGQTIRFGGQDLVVFWVGSTNPGQPGARVRFGARPGRRRNEAAVWGFADEIETKHRAVEPEKE